MRPPAHLEALRALCQQQLPAATLVPALLEALHGVVPSARNLFDWTDDDGRLLRYYVEGPIDTALAQLYFDEFHNRLECEAMPAFQALRDRPAGVSGPGELDRAGFHDSALYHEIWKPQGLHSRLEAVLRGPTGRLLGSLVLYRGPHDAAFTAAEQHRLARLLPLLSGALDAAAADGQAAPDDGPHLPAPEPAETLLVAPDGRPCHASPGALRLLLMAEGGASPEALARTPRDLAQPLLADVLPRLRHRPHDEVRICHSGPGGLLAVGARLLQGVATDGPAGQPLVHLHLRRLEPHRVALERALRGLPLTPGQLAVCRALDQGLPQPRIGQRLGVAPSTVVDHVRKAYRALDLHGAGELRALLDARIAQAAA
jgi:DNA-binding CsgD family transcriptional regulator